MSTPIPRVCLALLDEQGSAIGTSGLCPIHLADDDARWFAGGAARQVDWVDASDNDQVYCVICEDSPDAGDHGDHLPGHPLLSALPIPTTDQNGYAR